MAKVAISRIVLLGSNAIVSANIGYYFGTNLYNAADETLPLIAAIFSILAAALFAVISIISDPSMLLSGNWRVGYESAKDIQARLQRLNLLFYWYLITLAATVICQMLNKAIWAHTENAFGALLFLTAFGLFASFSIPPQLMKIQTERLEREIKDRKNRKQKS